MSAPSSSEPIAGVSVREMRVDDLTEARRIFRIAFGTFINVPDPESFSANREAIFTRWRADPEAALAAEVDGALAGSNFLSRWGSFGFFGPLTVRPDLWNRKVGQALLGPTMDLFAKWGVRQTGLYTFSNSPKHVALYQKFGFWPRFLTAGMAKEVTSGRAVCIRFSTLADPDRAQALDACRELTDSIYAGLDVSVEIRSVHQQQLGDIVLLWDDRLEAFAVCYGGEGTEGGPDNCYLKFAAVRPGPQAEKNFGRLLDGCEAFALERGWHRIEAGVNLTRAEAYRHLLGRGFRTLSLGVAMHRPDEPAFNRPGVYVMDDWR